MISANPIACVVAMLCANAIVSAQDACQRDLILASDGDTSDKYGIWIDIDGDRAVVGAYQNDALAVWSGSAYVLQNVNGKWVEQTKIFADDGWEVDRFGWATVIEGDTIVVGAPDDDDMGGNSGSVYVFQFDGRNWVQHQKLLADDGAAPDLFGHALAIDGDTLVVGAENKDSETGAAYVFTRSKGVWSQQQKLTASDGEILDAFGYAVAVQDDQIVVSAIGDDDVGDTAGAAYVFTRIDNIWTEQTKIVAPGGRRPTTSAYPWRSMATRSRSGRPATTRWVQRPARSMCLPEAMATGDSSRRLLHSTESTTRNSARASV